MDMSIAELAGSVSGGWDAGDGISDSPAAGDSGSGIGSFALDSLVASSIEILRLLCVSDASKLDVAILTSSGPSRQILQ